MAGIQASTPYSSFFIFIEVTLLLRYKTLESLMGQGFQV